VQARLVRHELEDALELEDANLKMLQHNLPVSTGAQNPYLAIAKFTSRSSKTTTLRIVAWSSSDFARSFFY